MNAMAENTHVMAGAVSDEVAAESGQTTPSSRVALSGSPTKKEWRVLVVDDNAADRTLLRALLEEHAEIRVVGEAIDGEESIVLAEQHRPDVILMDICLPHINGAEATRHIKMKLPACTVIGVSSVYTPQSYNEMIAAGAVAFVRKEDAVEALYRTFEFAKHACSLNRRPSTLMKAPPGK